MGKKEKKSAAAAAAAEAGAGAGGSARLPGAKLPGAAVPVGAIPLFSRNLLHSKDGEGISCTTFQMQASAHVGAPRCSAHQLR
mmetsp:Transcript_15921/g.40445  ORF Transcript_15921/g.40445 Transcript_15921/m.40445 type:complete len:83 (-) Transcript_15921:61-309(-)